MVLAQDLLVGVGSLTDCRRLVELFISIDNLHLDFKNFTKAWRDMNFDLIFCGHIDKKELSQLSDELFRIAKNFTLEGECFAERLGGLYLMYGLYYTQPSRVQVRFTLKELKGLMDFLSEVKSSKNKEAEFVLLKLFVDNSFFFCATPTDHTKRESKKLSAEDGESELPYQTTLLECCSNLIQYGDAYGTQVNETSAKYEDIKAMLPGPSAQLSVDSKSNFAVEFISSIKALQDNIPKMSTDKDDNESDDDADCIEENLDQREIRERIRDKAFNADVQSISGSRGKFTGSSKSHAGSNKSYAGSTKSYDGSNKS